MVLVNNINRERSRERNRTRERTRDRSEERRRRRSEERRKDEDAMLERKRLERKIREKDSAYQVTFSLLDTIVDGVTDGEIELRRYYSWKWCETYFSFS